MNSHRTLMSFEEHPAFLRLREKFGDVFSIPFSLIEDLKCQVRLGNLSKSGEPILRKSEAVGVGKIERFILLCEGILDEFSEPVKPEIDIWNYQIVTTS